MRMTGQTILEEAGYEVLLAENGQQAIALYEQNPDAIDLVILDMIMPVMGGRETFFKLRELKPDLPILISSGFAKESDLKDLYDAGVSGTLHKPFRQTEMSEVIANILKQN